MTTAFKDTYVVLVDVLGRDGLDTKLVHANTDVLARRIVARTAGKGRVDAVGMLKSRSAMLRVRLKGVTYPVGLRRQVTALVNARGRL